MKCKKYNSLAEKLLKSDGKRVWKLEKKVDAHIRGCPVCQQGFQQLTQNLVENVPNAIELLAEWQTGIEIQQMREGWIEVPKGIPSIPGIPLYRKIIDFIKNLIDKYVSPLFEPQRRFVLGFSSIVIVVLLCVLTVVFLQQSKIDEGNVAGGFDRVRGGKPYFTIRGIQPPVSSLVGFEELAFEYRPQGAKEIIHLSLPSDKTVTLVSEKDEFRLVARPTQDCWLYIFQLDSTSHLFQLFPNPQFTPLTNPVKGEQSFSIPGGERWFYLDKNIGKEQIFIVVSNEQKRDWERLYERYHQSPDGSSRQQALNVLVTTLQSVVQTPTQELSGYVFKFNHK